MSSKNLKRHSLENEGNNTICFKKRRVHSTPYYLQKALKLRKSFRENVTSLLSESSECSSAKKTGFSKCHSAEYLWYLEMVKSNTSAQDLKYSPPSQDTYLDRQLFYDMIKQENTKEFRDIFAKRKKLPSYEKQKEIVDLIEKNQVVILVGETGCGKSTQVPQYILDSYIESRKGSLCKIVCTQPRRISAIAIAERVAAERCVPCGEMGEVGYQIRLENNKPRECASILFCTTGILLAQLQSNPTLHGISHVIIDEVHERDQLIDFLMTYLRDLIKFNAHLKIVLMSATMNVGEISSYFGNCPAINIPGHTYPVKCYLLEDMIEKTGYKPKESSRTNKLKMVEARRYCHSKAIEKGYWKNISSRYSYSTFKTLQKWDEDKVDLNLVIEMLKYICRKGKDGSILVFLPGWQEISKVFARACVEFPKSRFLIIPLHSQTSSQYEKQVIHKTPKGMRKIILATNIAETSITIDDCTVIIDCGKAKEKNFDPLANMHILQPHWISLSNIKQRKGRAGRTQPGVCFHMFTKMRKMALKPFQTPEIQRCSLEQLILKIKVLKECDITLYFQKMLSPPKPETVAASLKTLCKLNALTRSLKLTPFGFLLSKLPVDIYVGKMLLYGAIFSCLDPITSIAACLSFKGPQNLLLCDWDVRATVFQLTDDNQSDHMAFVNALKKWNEVKDDDELSKQFCYKYFLSSATLKRLMELKQQYATYLKQLHFLDVNDPSFSAYNVNSENESVIKGIICAAFYPNIAKVQDRDHREYPECKKPLVAITKDGDHLDVYPNSVNAFVSFIETGWLVYSMKMLSRKIYIHDTTDIYPDYLLMFGNKVEKELVKGQRGVNCLIVDGWIQFNGSEKNCNRVLYLRDQLITVMKQKFSNPSPTNWQEESKEVKILGYVASFLSEIKKFDNGFSSFTWKRN